MTKSGGPLTPAEIEARIAQSGYPFEYEVYGLLQNPAHKDWTFEHGARVETGRDDGSTRDVDLLGSRVTVQSDRRLTSVLYVEAKRLFGHAFVGFRAPKELSGAHIEAELRTAIVGGFPGPMDSMGTAKALRMPKGLGVVLAQTLATPDGLCAQWAVAREEMKRDQKTADQPQAFRDDIAGSIRAAVYRAHRESCQCRRETDRRVDMEIYLPVIVVDGGVFFYDMALKTAKAVDHLVLRVSADTLGGARFAAVDVVTTKGLEALMGALNEFLNRHMAAIFAEDATVNDLSNAAKEQLEKFQWNR